MATGVKPPIIDTTVVAWRDAFAALSAMPVACGITFVILLVLSLLGILIMPDPTAGALSSTHHIVGFISSVIQAFVVAPLAIAVHRYVLLGERAGGYALDLSSPRYMRFVGFAVLINVLLSVPAVVISLLPTDPENIGQGAVGGIVALVLFIIIAIVAVRRAILFPAVAVDAAGATWKNARDDTKGNSWRVLFIMICTSLPVIAISVPLYWVLIKQPAATLGNKIVFAVLTTVIQIPTICAFAAAASHVFRTLADNLARPAGGAGPAA